MVGEAMHDIGRDGAIRAKRWLDATTRVRAAWLNTDPGGAKKLSFKWPGDNLPFSYDLGGILRGGSLENAMFLAECKKYTTPNQGPAYREYLAKGYVVVAGDQPMADHLMWITWHPFLVSLWNSLCAKDYVTTSVVEYRHRIFGRGVSEMEAKEKVDLTVCETVAERLWLVVLNDRQEQLVISKKHRGVLMDYEVSQGAEW